jgi:hypothetical protein
VGTSGIVLSEWLTGVSRLPFNVEPDGAGRQNVYVCVISTVDNPTQIRCVIIPSSDRPPFAIFQC